MRTVGPGLPIGIVKGVFAQADADIDSCLGEREIREPIPTAVPASVPIPVAVAVAVAVAYRIVLFLCVK